MSSTLHISMTISKRRPSKSSLKWEYGQPAPRRKTKWTRKRPSLINMLSFARARSLNRLAIALLAVILVALHATAQTASPAASSRLASVSATGSVRFQSDQIAQASGLKPGDTVTREDLQKAADRLVALGLFATVHYRFSTVDTGVKVEYQVTDAPAVPVSFDNFPWLTDDELVAELKNTVFLFDGTAPEHGAILDQMSASIEKLLERHSVFASVRYAAATSPVDNHDVVQFSVEGAGLNVQSIDFTDALAKSDRGIHDQLPLLVDKPFSRSAIETFEAEQIRPIYLSHGFLRVQFAPPIARLEGSPTRNGPNPVDVVAPIFAGATYTWGGVTWTGNSSRRANYSCVINEGTQYHMGKLILSGLSVEGERRVRITWRISQGAVFNEIEYEDFLVNGMKAAFMGFPAHYEKIGRFLQKDAKTGVVDVLLDFQ